MTNPLVYNLFLYRFKIEIESHYLRWFFFHSSLRFVLFVIFTLIQAEAAQIAANGKKNDDIDADSKHDAIKILNGQTNIYKIKIDTTTTRSRHYVGSAN